MQPKALVAVGRADKAGTVRIPFGCISIIHFTDCSDFSSFGYKFSRILNLYYL